MPLKLTRRKGSSVWHVVGTINGQRYRESTGIPDRALAEEWRSKREQEIFRGAIYGQKAVVTWEEAVVSYSEVRKPSPPLLKILIRLTRHFGGTKLKDIDQSAIDRAMGVVCGAKATGASKHRTVVVPVRAVMNHAFRRGWCERPAFEALAGAAGRKRSRWLSPAEFIALRDGAPPFLRPLIVFLICTGARLGEALSLQWSDVDLDHARLTLRNVKARHGEVRDRIVSLCPSAVAMLSAQPHRHGGVFRQSRGGEYPITKDQNNKQIIAPWLRALRAAGLDRDVTPHVLRHSWATWRYAIHRDVITLRDEGGWASISQVERYTKNPPEYVGNEARRIWGLPTDTHPTRARPSLRKI